MYIHTDTRMNGALPPCRLRVSSQASSINHSRDWRCLAALEVRAEQHSTRVISRGLAS